MLAAAFLALLAQEVPIEQRVYWRGSQWTVIDNRGTCSLDTAYESGTSIMLFYDYPRNRVSLHMGNPAWTSIVDERTYQVTTRFGNGASFGPGDARGKVYSDGSGGHDIILYYSGNSFLEQFAESAGVTFTLGTELIASLSLNGSRAAIAQLRQCALQSYRRNPNDPFRGVGAAPGATEYGLRTGSAGSVSIP